jgi:4-hydroxy-4-methyl-2-oxoglutarate aldolase
MPTLPGIPEADLERLRNFDTPTVCNVIELFDYRPRTAGYLDRRIQAAFPKLPPMVGYASTATFRSSAPPRSGDVYSGLADQVATLSALPGPAVVVFQDLDSPCAAATFGEIMCRSYQAFGAAGLITSGAGRDLDQVEALGFPCFTDGTVAAHGYCHILQLDIPVHVGGVMIRPGDLLHGDRNGVTIIPLDIASAVAGACLEFVAAEGILLDYLKSEKVTPEGYATAQAQSRERIEILGRRLRHA